ncbi:protein dispatched homolog 1-like [Amphiura filiformis]|uniref:protein dispatched homolog 1-like n=1 Tax=Amphiura filiformis TaxID=82378 RepID=UPI003B20EB59
MEHKESSDDFASDDESADELLSNPIDDVQILMKPDKGFCYRYCEILVHHPVSIFVMLLTVSAVCGVISLFAYDKPKFDDPIKGFEARGMESIKRLITGRHLMTDNRLHFMPIPNMNQAGLESESISDSGFNDSLDVFMANEKNESGEALKRTRRQVGSHRICQFSNTMAKTARIVFTPVQGNSLFTLEGVKSMCSLQNTINDFTATVDRSNLDTTNNKLDQCKNTWSILDPITSIHGKTYCEEITDYDLKRLRDLLKTCVSYYELGLLTDSCDDMKSNCQSQVPDECLSNNTVVSVFHYLTPTSFVKAVRDNTSRLESTMMFLNINESERHSLYMNVFEDKTVSDGITKVDAVQFFMKFDLFRQYLNSDTKYIASGVAVAVVIIMWYTGSLFITAMTILNIGMSFTVAYFLYKVVFQLSFFPFVNILTLVLLIGIGADDTFVFMDIWIKTKADLPGNDLTSILYASLRHAAVTMFVTSFTTASALFTNIINPIVAIKCFAVFAGTAIMVNFIFTITWLPVVIVIDDWCNERWFGWHKSLLKQIKNTLKPLTKVFDKLISLYFPMFIFKFRYLWIVLFASFAIVGAFLVFVTPKLKMPTLSVFRLSNHPMEKYDQIYKHNYEFEQDNDNVNFLPYVVVFGAIPNEHRSLWNPDSKATDNVSLDDTFDVSDPGSQQWLVDFCSDIRKQPFVNNHYDVHCFIEVVISHMQMPCPGNPVIPDICCERTDFPYSKEHFQKCAPIICAEFMDCAGLLTDYFHLPIPHGPLYSGDNTISAFSIVATSVYKDTPEYVQMDEFWTTADSWTTNQITKAPPGMKCGWFITAGLYQIYFYAIQIGLANGTLQSMGISLVIGTLILLLTTRNVLIALYAILSVSGTILVTIGTLILLGWHLNIIECVLLSLGVGLSIDFTIHYGVAYCIAPVTDRKELSEFALKSVGSAIIAAAVSTFMAGAMMMPAKVLSYSQLGVFLMLIMSTSWVYANFFSCPSVGCSVLQIT